MNLPFVKEQVHVYVDKLIPSTMKFGAKWSRGPNGMAR